MPHYSVSVKDTVKLSKNMRRIVFTDKSQFTDANISTENSISTEKSLADFPETSEGSYVKLMFDHQGNAIEFQAPDAPRPRLRTYTVKSIDRQAQEITIDFALHSHNDANDLQTSNHLQFKDGPASRWAENANVGDKICFAGPGSSKSLADKYDWVLLAGDITALPSIENYLSHLPADTAGFAFIQVPENDDIRTIEKPENLQIVWINDPQSLADCIANTKLLSGNPAIWAACEFSQMRALRQLFTKDMGISRNQIYISSYWKKGRSEEQHKVDKRDDFNQEQGYNQEQQRQEPLFKVS